ncbi:DNA/RNA non-specific endonuclease [Haloactinopolyspora alba]|uniref:DNA/RNA non-specific endonuclease n=1 Tax=Haloactinopolyspora alba TaxID=648780 RepID=A0A2P8EF67_9ACTN|nr:DNA/RNA non-specific endonuclease [Haloactinopolyspora alba]PSL08119.1 DNA/RNA non-specific endonuclease [Haloactinopolyspora alba]
MSDRPIEGAVEGLAEVRDATVPQEIDGLLDFVRGDIENVRRLVERATYHAAEASTLEELDAVEARTQHELRGLGDEVAGAISEAIDELTALKRPSDHTPAVVDHIAPAAAHPPVVHLSSTDPKDADLRANPPAASVLVVDETTVYTADEHRRVVRVDATLTATQPGQRNEYAQRTLAGKLDGDDAGHLIAHMLGGIGDKLNLTPMTRDLNRSKFATIENTWREAVTAGKPVEVEIALHYPDEGPRSSAITVTYTIDGRRRRVKLPNTPPGGSQ